MIFHSYVKLQEGDKERMGMHGDIYVSRGEWKGAVNGAMFVSHACVSIGHIKWLVVSNMVNMVMVCFLLAMII
jgi:hypothetical protein